MANDGLSPRLFIQYTREPCVCRHVRALEIRKARAFLYTHRAARVVHLHLVDYYLLMSECPGIYVRRKIVGVFALEKKVCRCAREHSPLYVYLLMAECVRAAFSARIYSAACVSGTQCSGDCDVGERELVDLMECGVDRGVPARAGIGK